MIGQSKVNFSFLLGGMILFSTLFMPDISIHVSLPALQLVDFCMPFVIGILFLDRKTLKVEKYFLFLLLFAAYILFTIILNHRYSLINEYFEVYKILKFLVLILFFSHLDIPLLLKQLVKPFFILLVLVNIFHFYNVFNINYILETAYRGDLNIKYFGTDTLARPAGKRMVGMAGNPNTNALLFCFFAVYFIPLKFKAQNIIWFFTALLFTFLCQSRTAMLILIVLLIAILVLKLSDWKLKNWLVIIACFSSYFIAWMLSSSFFKYPIYSNSMFNGVAMGSNSAMGRLEVWKFLGKMILEKPIFGHGPNKNFFYENKIYSENEYILYTWRYGLVGLIAYLGVLIYPLILFYKQRKEWFYKTAILFTLIMLISALTNNPFTERHVFIIFTFSLACLFYYVRKNHVS